ncbi:hypothetical protein SISSUDRAFT_1131775 [Sistotremastrum suecicum HHB10207 ss-3]|uniref:F-box domain-containing protein n=1 Tax=Sistotremastrum suecicum HHB10207 ss-3 TaxID=1314776 RepID=A0A165ZRT4_9AGAM|nr:hypothetical protein SISSUDRAFT_1131775 [Sistotremastrum suecicum HHB10207 ss-3]
MPPPTVLADADSLQQTLDSTEKGIDTFLKTVLKNADVSCEPWASRLVDIRRDAHQLARMKSRVTTAIHNIVTVENIQHIGDAEELTAFRDAKAKELSEGEVLEKIIYSAGMEGVILRREMNRLLPVIQMPVELIGMIFEHYAADVRELLFWSDMGVLPETIRISQICSHWRIVALDNGSLWSHINFSWPQKVVSGLIERSRGSPLDFMVATDRVAPLTGGDMDSKMDSVELIIRHIHRLDGLNLLYVQPDSDSPGYGLRSSRLMELWDQKGPMLRHLSVKSKPATSPSLGTGLFRNFPNLRTMEIIGCVLPKLESYSLLPLLRKITIVSSPNVDPFISIHEFIGFLDHTPNLEEMTLRRLDFRQEHSTNHNANTRVELKRCKKLELFLPSSISPNFFLSSVIFSQLDAMLLDGQPNAEDALFRRYSILPSYVRDMLSRCKTLMLHPRLGHVIVADYHMTEDIEDARHNPDYSLWGNIGSFQNESGMPPVLASVTSHLPLGTITTLSLDSIVDEVLSPDIWKAFLAFFPDVTRLEIHGTLKKYSLSFCKALGDPSILPMLTRLDIDVTSFNVKEVNRAFASRERIGNLRLDTLYIWDFEKADTMPRRPIYSKCATFCFTNSESIHEF